MHTIKKKIYYHDTDCGGVVYYANYLKYFEEARTEFLADKNIDTSDLSNQGILFVVKEVNISYKKPACYGQILDIQTKLNKVKPASLLFFQTIKLKELTLVSAETKLACINKEFKACMIPEKISIKLNNDL